MHRLLIVAVVAQLLMLPYRINNYIQFGTFSWVRLDYYWQMMWQPESVIQKNGGGFAVLGGITLPTLISPGLAKDIENNLNKFGQNYYSDNFYKYAAVKTFIKKPLEWLRLKVDYIPHSWFDSLYEPYETLSQWENWLYAYLFWTVLGLSIFRIVIAFQNFYRDTIVDLFFLSVFTTQFAWGTFFHFEPRYFYFMKIILVVIASIYIAMYCRFNRKPA